MSRNLETIQAFMAAWNSRDVDALISLLADDVCYHNMPFEPMFGAAKVRELLAPFLSSAEDIHFDVSHMAEASDGAVLVEKVERYTIKGEKIVLESMNTFELEDGKITLWRGYFDSVKWSAEHGRID